MFETIKLLDQLDVLRPLISSMQLQWTACILVV